MTEEEKEAIENLKKLVELRKDKTNTIKHDTCICSTKELDIALNLIKKQQEEPELKESEEEYHHGKMYIELANMSAELEKKEYLYQKALSDLVKADKMIEKLISAMAKNHCSVTDIVQEYICDNKCVGNNDWNCEKCIKQYFEKQVEKE